jgi:hypothetical protein
VFYDQSRHFHLSSLLLIVGIAALLTPIVIAAFRYSFDVGMFTLGAYLALVPLLAAVLLCKEKDPDACVDVEKDVEKIGHNRE